MPLLGHEDTINRPLPGTSIDRIDENDIVSVCIHLLDRHITGARGKINFGELAALSQLSYVCWRFVALEELLEQRRIYGREGR